MESEYTESNTSDTNKIFKYELKSYNHNDRKNLNKRMSEIKSKKCYKKIFKIIHEENLKDPKKNKYTTNDNGVFFNLNTMSDEVLSKIDAVISLYETKYNPLSTQYEIDHSETNETNETNETDDNVSSEYKTIQQSNQQNQQTARP